MVLHNKRHYALKQSQKERCLQTATIVNSDKTELYCMKFNSLFLCKVAVFKCLSAIGQGQETIRQIASFFQLTNILFSPYHPATRQHIFISLNSSCGDVAVTVIKQEDRKTWRRIFL